VDIHTAAEILLIFVSLLNSLYFNFALWYKIPSTPVNKVTTGVIYKIKEKVKKVNSDFIVAS
jgi:hypothetical protein